MTRHSARARDIARLFVFLLSLVALEVTTVTAQQTQLTTRQQVIRPLALPPDTQEIPPSDVADYGLYGYTAWQAGPGEFAGQRLDLMPAGYT
jgi:hypothetical protein